SPLRNKNGRGSFSGAFLDATLKRWAIIGHPSGMMSGNVGNGRNRQNFRQRTQSGRSSDRLLADRRGVRLAVGSTGCGPLRLPKGLPEHAPRFPPGRQADAAGQQLYVEPWQQAARFGRAVITGAVATKRPNFQGTFAPEPDFANPEPLVGVQLVEPAAGERN